MLVFYKSTTFFAWQCPTLSELTTLLNRKLTTHLSANSLQQSVRIIRFGLKLFIPRSKWFILYTLVLLHLNFVKNARQCPTLSPLFALLRHKTTAHLFANHLPWGIYINQLNWHEPSGLHEFNRFLTARFFEVHHNQHTQICNYS
jgi:hypothetical protein